MDFILIANLVFAGAVVFIERKRPAETLTWLLLLTFLPVVGFVLYILFGQKLLKQRRFRLKREDDQRLRALIAQQHQVLSVLHEQAADPRLEEYFGLVHMNLIRAAAPVTLENEVTIFTHGDGKFQQLLEEIQAAERFIHMEYFIFRGDEVGRRVVAALAERAGAGVEVRLIIDAWGSRLTPPSTFQPLLQAGGKVQRFLPVSLTWGINVNYRNHRKIVVIDGVIAYTGGMNIGDEYRGLRSRNSPWRDTHLRIRGPAVTYLESRFMMDWIYVSGEEMELGERYLPPATVVPGASPMQIVSSGPDSDEQHVKQGYLKMISQAKERLYIQTPYLVPDESILDALKVASFSGVDVRVMVPGKPDNPLVYRVTMSYVGELLAAGVRVFIHKGFLHSKAVVADRLALSIGTANMDVRSFALNFEVNAFIFDEVKATEYTAIFEEDMRDCRELTLEEYRNRGLWPRFSEGICRLFAPIM